ncbi:MULTISPECIES: hypothetical protein [Bacteroidales]|jgi:hypothetical protein|uniref:DUF7833 domain-containing protein n=1 Tax=Bacteroidales TaxID=171549 RepID=UPI00256EF23F|nr:MULTISPECIES: hypothetical protein [Bacteroidales]
MNLSWIPVLHYLRNVEWLYSESRMVHLWLEILFRVQRSADTYPIKGTTIDIMPGQFVASTRKLAAAIGADKDTVGRYLKILESQRWIERRDIGNATLYTILAREQIPEFSFYAKDRDAGSSRPNILPTSGDTPSDTSGDTFGDIYHIENNINKNSLSHAHEEEIFDFFQKDKASINEIAAALHCGVEKLEAMLADFFTECRIKKKHHPDAQECKDHFFNWARARLNREQQNVISQENRPVGSRQGNQRGRRTPVKPDCGLIED